MTNPYISTPPTMKVSVVVFLDLLGFSQQVLDACEAGQGNKLLCELHTVLNTTRDHIDPGGWGGDDIPDLHAIKTFTDNVVLGYPITSRRDTAAENEFGHALSTIPWYQFNLALQGFFVRGGLAVADHYMDDEIVFGPGIVEAANLEKTADYPRVILGPSAVDLVKRQMKFYGDQSWAPQDSALAVDEDGKVFLNYLDCVNVEPEYGPNQDWLEQHADQVGDNLKKHADPRVLRKYEWLAAYHNWYCSQFRGLSAKVQIQGVRPRMFKRLSELP